MNLKLVLRTYSALRQLTDDESALLSTLRNLNDSEREQLVESLAPVKGTGKGIKKTRKPRTKSAHQQSLSSAIQKAGKGRVEDDAGDSDSDKCAKCNESMDHNLHHLKAHPDYHEFVVSEKLAAASGD